MGFRIILRVTSLTFGLESLSAGVQVCHLPPHHPSPVETCDYIMWLAILHCSVFLMIFVWNRSTDSFSHRRFRPAQSHTEVSCPANTCHSATERACGAAEVNLLHTLLAIQSNWRYPSWSVRCTYSRSKRRCQYFCTKQFTSWNRSSFLTSKLAELIATGPHWNRIA